MTVTVASKRTVFRTIAEHPDYHWPYYRLPDTEYTATDLGALEHDVHRLASVWFKQDVSDDVEAFICWCPFHYLDFATHDTHPAWYAQSKFVVPMVRTLMLMVLHLYTKTGIQGYLCSLKTLFLVVPQTELETALANAYPQDLEKLAVDLLSKRDYNVDPTGTSGADGGLDALLHDGDRAGALHVSRTRSDRLRQKITSDADKLADHDKSYDFLVFVTTADPSGSLRRRLEAEVQETYGWKTDIWAREQLRNALMTEYQGLAQDHLNVDPGVQLDDHQDEILDLRNGRLDRIETRSNLPNELPDGPALTVHLIPNNVLSSGLGTHPGDLPTPPFFGHTKRVVNGGKPIGDGVVAFNLRFRQEHPDYVYLNEAGWVEAISTEYFRPTQAGPGGFIDPKIDRSIGATVKGVLYCFDDLGVKPPVFVSISLLNVDQYVIDTNEYLHFESRNFPGRFTTPLAKLQHLDPDEFELEHLRPVLDRMWYQAGSSDGSPHLPNLEDSSPHK